jgi:hypothetical protein
MRPYHHIYSKKHDRMNACKSFPSSTHVLDIQIQHVPNNTQTMATRPFRHHQGRPEITRVAQTYQKNMKFYAEDMHGSMRKQYRG